MSLNLASLKNLTPATTDISLSLAQTTPRETLETTQITTNIPEKSTVSALPKISLMKLKKDSGMEYSSTSAVTEELTEVQVSDHWVKTIEAEEVVNIVPEEEVVISPIIETVPLEPVTEDSKESQSIFLSEEVEEIKDLKSENKGVGEMKEFFPNFHVSDELDLDEDLLDLQDFVTIKEHEPITSQETINSIANMDLPPVSEAMSTITIPEEISDNIEMITPEYVAEVKTELSENRRAGFRFFIQKKTKIIASVSLVVISALALTLFSDSFLSTDMQKSGKSNIQEIVKNPTLESTNIPEPVELSETAIEVTPVEETVLPSAEKIGYEAGRDYSVTKNTKKNVSSRTLSGTEIPTP